MYRFRMLFAVVFLPLAAVLIILHLARMNPAVAQQGPIETSYQEESSFVTTDNRSATKAGLIDAQFQSKESTPVDIEDEWLSPANIGIDAEKAQTERNFQAFMSLRWNETQRQKVNGYPKDTSSANIPDTKPMSLLPEKQVQPKLSMTTLAKLEPITVSTENDFPNAIEADYVITFTNIHKNDWSGNYSTFYIINDGLVGAEFYLSFYWPNGELETVDGPYNIDASETMNFNMQNVSGLGMDFYGDLQIYSGEPFSADVTSGDFGVIQGTVFHTDGEAPLGSVSVETQYQDGWGAGSMDTRSDGQYWIAGLNDTDYRLSARPNYPFAFQFYSGVDRWDDAQVLSISSGNDLMGYDFTLQPGGIISGVVTDELGIPLENINVDLDQGWYGTCTDAEGRYQIQAVPYDDQFVVAARDWNWCLNEYNDTYISEYYNNSYVRSEADAVTVNGDQDIHDYVNFELEAGSSITGRITDETSGLGLPNFLIQATSYDTEELKSSTLTDEDGYYTINRLPAEDYRVRFDDWNSLNGYAIEYYDDKHYHHLADRVTVGEMVTVTDVDMALEPAGIISGFVYDQDTGIPLANMKVELESETEPGSHGACTDSNGYFEFFWITYDGYRLRTGDANNWLCDGQDTSYVAEYYQDQYRWQDAQVIWVDAGTPVVGDLEINLEKGGSISGRVFDADTGDGLSGVRIEASTYDDEWYWANGWSDPNGYYTITGLVAEDFRLRITDWNWIPDGYAGQYYNDTYDYGQADRVTVDIGDELIGYDFPLHPGGKISGRVVDQNTGQGLANINVDAGGYSHGYGAGSCTDNDGYYTVGGLPYDDFKVRAPSGDGWNWCTNQPNEYATEYYDNVALDWDAIPVTVDAGTPEPSGIDFTLVMGGYVSGHVEDDAGTPMFDLDVVAQVPDPNCPWCSGGWWIVGSRTDANGDYLLGPISPDIDVAVYACTGCSNLPLLEEYYNDVYRIQDATYVNVTPGSPLTIDFVLDPGVWITGHVTVPSGYSNVDMQIDAWTTRSEIGYGTGRRTDNNGDYIVPVPAYGDTFWAVSARPYGTDLGSQRAHDFDITRQTQWDFDLGFGGMISGCVVDENDNPVPWVYVNADANEVNEGTQTGANGCYEITNLPPADYRIWADNWPDYYGVYYGGFDWDWADIVHLSLAEAETGKDFVLPHLGRLEGVVSSSDTGEVFENVEVTAFNETSYFKAWSQTDGFYGLDLPIGDYWIVYNLSDEVTDNEGWELNEGFHGDQWDFSSAVSVTIPFYNNDPVNTLVVDKVMTRFPRLHGRIVDSSTSLPIAGARVVVVKQDLPQFIFNHSTNCTDETGEYILPHIDPGETLVTVLGACGNAWSFHPYTTTITFNDGDDVLLDVALTPGSIEEQFTVRVDDPGDFTPLTGLFVSNYGGSNNDVTPLLFTPLVALNDQHQWFSELLQQVPLEINGGVVISGNQMVVTYQLKSGLLWSDGHPLTSEDIQYVWQYYQRPQFWMDTYLLQINPLFKIERIETPNTLTAVVYYKPEEFPSNYLEALPYTYPKHVLENIPWVFHRWTSEFSHKPVGNGPYIVADFLPGVYANLIPNPNYHKQLSGYPKIQNMRLIFGEHPFYCLVNNDCDVSINIGNYVPANYTDYDLQVIKTASTTYEELHLNLDLPLFQDIKVRQALAYALNNEGFFQDDTINITADTWMPVDNPVFLDKGYSKYSFNLGQAAALLASAGWVDTDSDGILEKDGEELTFTLTYIGSNILRQNMALMYQEDLETIGVKLILDPRDDWWESARRGELDSFISGWIFDTFSEVLGFGLFHSSSIPTAYNNYQGSNLNRWQNSVNDVILENARVELDQVTLKNLYGDQLLVYGDQVPGIPTRWYARTDGAIPILLNFKPTQSIPVTWNAEQWEVPANPYDASVSKVLSVDSPAPIPGAVITYVITAKNAGYFPLDGYTILDELSDKVTYLGAIPAPSSISGNKLYWNMGTVPGKTTLPLIKVRVQVLETAVYGDILTNKVQVYSNQIDNRPSNNAFFHTTQVLGNVDLDINKSGVGLPIVGEDFDYYITYANWGGAPATDVVITDTLPAGVTYLGATPTPSNIDGNELIWNIGTLPGNQFGGQIIIHTQVSDSGVILNEAEIACSEAGSLSDDHTENVTDIAEPLITQPTSGTADGTPTLEGLAPPDSVVDFYDLTSLMKADQMGIDNPLAESWVASTTATVDGTFTLELALPEGTYSIFARSSKSTLTSDMSNVATFNVKHDLDIDPDYVQVSSRGVVISNGVVRAERRTLAFEVLDIQAQLSCSANPSAMLQVIENGMFYYNIPPYAASDIGGGNWLVKFRYYLGNLHSSYEIKLKWNCSGTPYEEVLIFILIDPDGYLYDQVEVDAGSAIEDALILNGIITAYVSTPDGWNIWPADVYGQYNPQWTDEETEDGVLVAGYYSFLTPPGLYRLEAFSPGYQPYQSPVLTVLNEPIHLDIGLLPLTGGSGALISPANLSASSKMVDQAEAWVGDILTYDLYVVNTGGLESSSLDVVDSLHAAVSYVNGSITTSGGGSAVYNEVDRTIEWSGSVPAGSQIHIHYKVLVATTGGDPFEISTSAALTGEQEDLAGVGDLKTSTWVLNQVGVMLVNDESGEAELGKSVTYQHTITNTGNFTDTFTFEAVSSLGWTVEIPDPIMLGAGESTMVEVVIHVPEGADEGDIDSTTLTVSSNMAPAYQDSVQLTTTALEKQDYLLYLPLTLRP